MTIFLHLTVFVAVAAGIAWLLGLGRQPVKSDTSHERVVTKNAGATYSFHYTTTPSKGPDQEEVKAILALFDEAFNIPWSKDGPWGSKTVFTYQELLDDARRRRQ